VEPTTAIRGAEVFVEMVMAYYLVKAEFEKSNWLSFSVVIVLFSSKDDLSKDGDETLFIFKGSSNSSSKASMKH
jgi:hypothetical protein